ncbi:hypothetical protein [Nesterenkonia sp. CF4.4]|uniref:hypothetical protein n=1 Tax=Nesterenkonia sp. CF4.4 TaxID=3373079 RepID=UPI003EE7A5C4
MAEYSLIGTVTNPKDTSPDQIARMVTPVVVRHGLRIIAREANDTTATWVGTGHAPTRTADGASPAGRRGSCQLIRGTGG